MTNAREYFRVAVPARVALRVLRPGEEQRARCEALRVEREGDLR